MFLSCEKLDNLENKTIIEYNYNDFNDYLTKFNGREIKYDSLSNPVLYKDIPLVWNHRELKKFNDIEFTYNINHIRTKKKTPNKDVEYILDGSTVLKEKRMNYTSHLESIIDEGSVIDTYEDELEYIYSPKGIIGFDYRVGDTKKRYYYNKNILGDILEIYDEDKRSVGKYSYDAYGNHKILLDIDSIATINPIRYRSYYYDSETQLYYLNNRYYDPEVCRFISMDSIEYINSDSINGLNLYAYCNNNPVMNVDPSGMAWWNPFSWDWAAIGRAIGGAIVCAAGLSLTIDTSRLALYPGLSFISQYSLSLMMYGGFIMASAFDSQIYEDMVNINWNPFNNDVNPVISSEGKVSFYKGQAVIKGDFPGCMSFGIMFVDKGAWVTGDVIRHEYGHFLQMGIYGVPKFTLKIAIPSLIGIKKYPSYLYDSLPWEVTADILGGAKGVKHINGSEALGWLYFIFF